ncbi:MAG: PaaI family thioesterase [Pseudomonadota bacterium]
MADSAPPEGFEPHYRESAFTDPWEPIYSQVAPDRVRIGLYLGPAHCNSRGLVHGGLIATLADNAMGLSCGEVLRGAGRDVAGLVTVNLSTDFLGSAKLGQWLVVDTDFVRAGGTLSFARALVLADGEPIARANATFKILKP